MLLLLLPLVREWWGAQRLPPLVLHVGLLDLGIGSLCELGIVLRLALRLWSVMWTDRHPLSCVRVVWHPLGPCIGVAIGALRWLADLLKIGRAKIGTWSAHGIAGVWTRDHVCLRCTLPLVQGMSIV